jgi:hypothetical protein
MSVLSGCSFCYMYEDDVDNRSIHVPGKNGYFCLPSNTAVGLKANANNGPKPTDMVCYQK